MRLFIFIFISIFLHLILQSTGVHLIYALHLHSPLLLMHPEVRPRNIENQGGGPSLGIACKTGSRYGVHERRGPTSSGLLAGDPLINID